MSKVIIGFINPPHADWSLANNLTYLLCQTHYKYEGKYNDKITWLEAPYKWDIYESYNEIYEPLKNAHIILFSSYIWNYSLIDDLAELAKKQNPDVITVLGGPHIGINVPSFLELRKEKYDFICKPTKPGEVFTEDLINSYVETNGNPCIEEISWELRSSKTRSCPMPSYSAYEHHLDYLSKTSQYAKEQKLDPFIPLETTRGCPYRCVYCEWGGGLNTKILKKDTEIVKKDILALKKAGFEDASLIDANFGAFEDRDLEFLDFAWNHQLPIIEISSVKRTNLNKRKDLIDKYFEIIKKASDRHGYNFVHTSFVVPSVALQSLSDEAMRIADRIDLSAQDKLELSRHIKLRCSEQELPPPHMELILGMPGSTIEDFYDEFEIIWNFGAHGLSRYDYMVLPDSTISNPQYLEKYNIETVEVYTDLIDEDCVDNWKSLYKNRRNYFHTIRSCYSYTVEEMHEMWFMNHAGNKLLQDVYPMFHNDFTPSRFAKLCYRILNKLPDFEPIHFYIVDLLDPDTPALNSKRIHKELRNEVINNLIEKAHSLIVGELYLELDFSNEK